MKRPPNAAKIRVTMPDGCKLEWETRPAGKPANDAKAFGHWLKETGDFIIEAASTPGQHAACDEYEAE